MTLETALAIDIGGTYTKLALVDSAGRIAASTSIPTNLDDGPDAYLNRVCQAAQPLLSQAPQLIGIGLAVAGFIDDVRSHITYNPNLRPLESYPLRHSLAARLSLPVTLDVDSNTACLAEYRHGAGRGAQRLLCLVIGTGFGGAMMIGGELQRLAAQAIGDPGHVIVEPGGALCSCGGHGCAEALVSAPAIEAAAGGGKPFPQVLKAAQNGEHRSLHALQQAGHFLGVTMATLSAIFLPDRIVVAGGVAEAGDLLLLPAQAAFQSCAGTIFWQNTPIAKASLGPHASLIGAACPLFAPSPQPGAGQEESKLKRG